MFWTNFKLPNCQFYCSMQFIVQRHHWQHCMRGRSDISDCVVYIVTFLVFQLLNKFPREGAKDPAEATPTQDDTEVIICQGLKFKYCCCTSKYILFLSD